MSNLQYHQILIIHMNISNYFIDADMKLLHHEYLIHPFRYIQSNVILIFVFNTPPQLQSFLYNHTKIWDQFS